VNEVFQKLFGVMLVIFLCTISACAPTTTYISIQYPDKIYERGKLLYQVNPGDQLEVMYTKTCPDGHNECWAVRNVKTNQIGYVFAKHMKGLHKVYKAPKSEVSLTAPIPPSTNDPTSTTYINIQYPDKVYEGGRFKFAVSPGDELELMYTKTCLNGRGECWVVRNVKTDEIGVMSEKRIKGLHKVYKAPAKKKLVTANAPVYDEEKNSDKKKNELHRKLKQLNPASNNYLEDNLYLYSELLKLEPQNSIYKYYVDKYKKELFNDDLKDASRGDQPQTNRIIFDQVSFVIVGKSDPAFTYFIAIPEEKLQEMKSKLAGENNILFVEWSEFSRNKNEYLLSSILVNEYPDSRVAEGVYQLLERNPGIPFGITWNGGVAFTSGDYEYVKKTYNLYMSSPEEYRRNRPRTEPITPELHFGPLLGW